MKIYKVSYYSKQHSSLGYQFFSSKSEAQKAFDAFKSMYGKDFDEQRSSLEVCNLVEGKRGILEFLKNHATHPNNG